MDINPNTTAEAHNARHQSAETDFANDPQKDMRPKKAKTIEVWKGDHRQCKHHSGVCDSAKAWMLSKEGGIRPIVINLAVEKRVMAMVEYDDDSGRGAEPVWRAKGHVLASEAEGLQASAQVLAHHVERGVNGLEKELENRRATHGEIVKAIADFRALYAAPDKAPPPPTTPLKRGSGRG